MTETGKPLPKPISVRRAQELMAFARDPTKEAEHKKDHAARQQKYRDKEKATMAELRSELEFWRNLSTAVHTYRPFGYSQKECGDHILAHKTENYTPDLADMEDILGPGNLEDRASKTGLKQCEVCDGWFNPDARYKDRNLAKGKEARTCSPACAKKLSGKTRATPHQLRTRADLLDTWRCQSQKKKCKGPIDIPLPSAIKTLSRNNITMADIEQEIAAMDREPNNS